MIQVLGAALKEVCDRSGFSSVHVNFCLADEVAALAALGFERRAGYQFQWINPGWHTFDDYLAAFRSKRRTQIKRERRELDAQGIRIVALTGDEIPDDLFTPMFRLYKATIDKLYWGHQYLNARSSSCCAALEGAALLLRRAPRRRVVAGTFNVRKGDVLYGRYWGAFEELRYLHFNVCYYAAIDYCLREGITRFEPGAGGEFKHLRGFDARPTTSMHYLARPAPGARGARLPRPRARGDRPRAGLDARAERAQKPTPPRPDSRVRAFASGPPRGRRRGGGGRVVGPSGLPRPPRRRLRRARQPATPPPPPQKTPPPQPRAACRTGCRRRGRA